MTDLNNNKLPLVHKKPDFNGIKAADDLETLKEIYETLVDSIGNKSKPVIKDEVLASIQNFNAFSFCSDLPQKINQIRASLYVMALRIKQDFILRTTELAKQENEFFKFTITLTYSKTENQSDEELTDQMNKGYLSGIYWSKRNAIVENGKVKKYIYKTLPMPQSKNKNTSEYTRKSFAYQGASKWQIEECLICEKKLATIRNILNRLSDIKRNLHWCSVFTNDLLSVMIKESNDIKYKLTSNLNSEIHEEENKTKNEDLDIWNSIKMDHS